jgi:hypothetical protein
VTAFRYVVIVDDEGRISTQVEEADEINKLQRTATTFDIYQTSKELVSDIESHLLADRVAKIVVDKLQPKSAAEEIKEKIISALNDRKQEAPLD